MPARPEDIQTSHAFLNTLWSSYQGMYVFLNVLARFEGNAGNSPALAQARLAVDQTHVWWKGWNEGQTLVRARRAPDSSAEEMQAAQLLVTHRGHLVWALRELATKSSARALLSDISAVRLRVAAYCQEAYSREHYVHGLVTYGKLLKYNDVVARWTPHITAAQELVARANFLMEWLLRSPSPTPEMVEQILDETLLLPLTFSLRILDIDRLLATWQGEFGFSEAGLPPEVQRVWADHGFSPYVAGQWFLAGIAPDESARWIQTGISDPYVASQFWWRSLNFDAAVPWIQAGIGGRAAAAWRKVGVSAADAGRWRQQGVEYPQQIPR